MYQNAASADPYKIGRIQNYGSYLKFPDNFFLNRIHIESLFCLKKKMKILVVTIWILLIDWTTGSSMKLNFFCLFKTVVSADLLSV
jgi:hypothetical protein